MLCLWYGEGGFVVIGVDNGDGGWVVVEDRCLNVWRWYLDFKIEYF